MIHVRGLVVQAGAFRLEDVHLEVPQGGCVALMGKTGSGKTTLLEAIAGLKRVQAGRIIMGGVDVTGRKPAERNLGYVPQDGALFTRMSVRDHLAFALVVRRWPRARLAARVAQLAQLLDIEQLLPRTPHGLSGGERQRVALGRALSFHPQTLCLDEPLTALDDATRGQMCALLQRLRRETGVTMLYVTHSLDEARRLADSIYRVDSGRVAPLAG